MGPIKKNEVISGSQKGFTLLELMVSTGVGMILLVIVLSILQVGGEGYGMTSRRIDTNVEARSALRIFSDDLAAVQFDDYFGVSAKTAALWPINEIWLMSLLPRAAQVESKATGDLCFVYYYTAVTGPLDELTQGPFSRKLYRRLISSADVMAALKGEVPPSGLGLPLPLGRPTPEPDSRVEDEAIAFNVVQFLVEPLMVDTVGVRRPWSRVVPSGGDEVVEPKSPDLMKVTLRVVDNETAGQLTKVDDWVVGGELATVLLGAEDDEGERLRTFEMTIPCGQIK